MVLLAADSDARVCVMCVQVRVVLVAAAVVVGVGMVVAAVVARRQLGRRRYREEEAIQSTESKWDWLHYNNRCQK